MFHVFYKDVFAWLRMCALPVKIEMVGSEAINCSAARLPTVHQLADMYGRFNDVVMELTAIHLILVATE